MGEDVIKEPFAVLNADDFYGRESFLIMANALKEMQGKKNHYCMIGYRLYNTLSESGSVSRGVCETDTKGYLTSVVERTCIERIDGVIKYKDADEHWYELADNTPVSMNLWGFTPDYFEYSRQYFIEFLEQNQHNLKSEFFIPSMIDHLISTHTADTKLLDTPSKWFGVTYPEDRQSVVDKLKHLSDSGEYPSPLWK